jgi:hypothetical protein
VTTADLESLAKHDRTRLQSTVSLSSRERTEDEMQTLASFLISEHIRELRNDADRERLVRQVASERTRAAWRRQTGHVARRLSLMLDGVAAQLDPVPCRPSFGRE